MDIGEDRILIESLKHGIVFDKFVNYHLNQERAQALFDKTSKVRSFFELQFSIKDIVNQYFVFIILSDASSTHSCS